MRYTGRDEEFDDEEEYYEDDDSIDVDDDLDDDDEESSSRSASSRVNPFTNRPGTTAPSTGLPGAGRSSVTGSNPSSASRLPGSPGPTRPGSPTSGSSGSSGSGSSYGGSSGSSGAAGSSGSRFGGSSGTSGSSGSGSSYGGSAGSSAASASSGSRFGGSSGTSGSSGSGSSYGGSSGSSGAAGSSGSRFGGSSGTSGSSGSGSSYGGSSGSSGAAGSSGSRFGGASGSSGSSSSSAKPDDKSKSASTGGGIAGRLGGLTSRLPGAGKSDDKKPASSSGGSSGGIAGRLGDLTGRGSGSSSSSSKPASSSSSSGGIAGRLGGLTSRIPGVGGKSDDKKPASSSSSSSAARPASSSSASSSSASAGAAKKPLFGSFSGGAGAAAKPATGAATAKSSGKAPAATGIARFLPFLAGGAAAKPAAKARTSKAPKVESEGLSLDSKLDILGVALILGALALFFSTLSSTKGQLTESINNFLSQLFGWGAIAIPVAMMAVGLWLVARHFGDEPPVVPTTRIIGIVMVFIGVLLVMQFVDTFSYVDQYGNPTTLASLRNVWLPIAIERGSGGGWAGANLYYLLASNITEFGAFFAMIGWLIVGLMFTLSISAAELAMILISVGRSFNDNRKQRKQRRAAAVAALQAAQLAAAAAAPALTISKEPAEALPAGAAAPALPAVATAGPELIPAALPERNIAINVGGRTLSAYDEEDELVPVEKKPAAAAASVSPANAPLGNTGGALSSRLRGMMPGGNKPAETPAPTPATTAPAAQAAQPALSMRERLLGKKPDTPAESKPAEARPSVAGVAATAAAGIAGAAISAATRPPASEDKPVPLGDLLRNGQPAQASVTPAVTAPTPQPPPAVNPTAGASIASSLPGGAPRSPFARPANEQPATPAGTVGARPFAPATPPPPAAPPKPPEKTAEELEAERLASLPPAKPRGTGPLPRPEENKSRFATSTFNAVKPDEAASPADRQSRLDAIRSGNMADVKPEDAVAASAEVKPAATVAPAAGTDAAKPAAPGVRPFGAPATPAAGDNKAQPAAAFWQTAQPAKAATPLPREDIKTPASTYGKPTMPPGMPEPAQQAPAASVEVAPKAGEPVINTPRPAEPPPPSAGVGRNAPVGVRRRKEWKLPNTSNLLQPGSDQEFDRESLLRRAKLIEDTLSSFGAPGKVVEVNTGPVITQFGVEPDYLVARGGKKNRVKVGAIAQLDKDIQLAMGAKSIRIEAPVPGKGYVGIEVPNEEAALVSLRDVMEADEFKRIDSPLTIALGQSVDGTPIAADLSSMPHLLIAGTTGSGKSVCVNAIITSIITLNSPDTVKFIMVDPKRVELTGYNGIPHLVAPVVVELERIVGVLKWVTREMDERYKKFSNAGARNIEDYNRHLGESDDKMPYIVVIIDELADLMMLAPDETERVITRIAALARATGIHLVIATQRPSVDVVTGLIKANFPARIAFAVAGGVDSRVILDQPGAEKLLGKGDMLYMSGDSPAPLRLQGVYVSDNEINNIVRYWRSQVSEDDVASRPISQLVLDNSVVDGSRSVASSTDRSQVQQAFWDRESAPSSSVTSLGSSDNDDDGDGVDDELYEEAVEMVRRLNKASVSLLQRRLRIGYTRAARLIDMMEEQGIVGPATEGSKPREVLPLD